MEDNCLYFLLFDDMEFLIFQVLSVEQILERSVFRFGADESRPLESSNARPFVNATNMLGIIRHSSDDGQHRNLSFFRLAPYSDSCSSIERFWCAFKAGVEILGKEILTGFVLGRLTAQCKLQGTKCR